MSVLTRSSFNQPRRVPSNTHSEPIIPSNALSPEYLNTSLVTNVPIAPVDSYIESRIPILLNTPELTESPLLTLLYHIFTNFRIYHTIMVMFFPKQMESGDTTPISICFNRYQPLQEIIAILNIYLFEVVIYGYTIYPINTNMIPEYQFPPTVIE